MAFLWLLSQRVFFFFQIRCIHNVTKRIKIPIESGCEWSIINGVSDGAFKYKGGLDVKYLDIFHDNNCAIYYPPRLEFDKPVKTKKIKLHLEIYPVIYGGLKKRITTVDFTGSDGVKNSIMINPEVKRSYLLNISLRRGIGFRNRNSYDAKLESKQILNDKDYDYDCDNDDKEISSELPVQQEQSCALYSSIPISDENGACIVCSIKEERYIECDLKFVPKFWPHMQSEWFKINLNDNRFFTSEYVSLNNLMYEVVKPREDSTNSDVPVAYFEIQNKADSSFKFCISNCPILKIFDTIWSTTSGSFPCGRIGRSVIFRSPQEKELRKSPITLSISKLIPSMKTSNQKSILLDQRKIILMRRMIFGG